MLAGHQERQAVVRRGERRRGGAPVKSVGLDPGPRLHSLKDLVAQEPGAGQLPKTAPRPAAP